jgi:hypothetical protein
VPEEELFGELGERYYRMMLRSYPALAVPTSQLTWNSGADMGRLRAGVGAERHRCEHVGGACARQRLGFGFTFDMS